MLRIEEVTETILSKDKDALIIFQSDHGTSMFKKILEKEDIIEESVNERLSITKYQQSLIKSSNQDQYFVNLL